MFRLFVLSILTLPGLSYGYDYDEYMEIAPRPTVPPKEITVPKTTDAPVGDIKPYEQTYDL